MDEKYGILIKFGELRHLRELRSKGLLYCNSTDFFAQLEAGHPAADPYEDVTVMKELTGGTIKLWEAEAPMPKDPFTMNPDWMQAQRHEPKLGNIFCMHFLDSAILHRSIPYKIDEKNGRKGNYFLIIENIREFHNRILRSATANCLQATSGFVKYRNLRTFSGTKGLFTKHSDYEHEKEWRVIFQPAKMDALQLYLGPINTISKIYQGNLKHVEVFLGQEKSIIMSNITIIDK